MRRPRIPVPGARRRLEAITRRCGSCGKDFTCLRWSVAEQLGFCRRCFERKMRFPGLCQRP